MKGSSTFLDLPLLSLPRSTGGGLGRGLVPRSSLENPHPNPPPAYRGREQNGPPIASRTPKSTFSLAEVVSGAPSSLQAAPWSPELAAGLPSGELKLDSQVVPAGYRDLVRKFFDRNSPNPEP
jgi:hypothetical protein